MKAKKFLHQIQAKNKQRAINKKYEKHGLTDEVLEEQVKLNTFRNLHDISDSSKRIYKNYVQ
jgi:hypothetical protein